MLGNIGAIYTKLKQNDFALNFFKKCLGVLKRLKDEYNQASVYNNLSIVYVDKKDLELAMRYSMQSKELYEKYKDKNGLVYCHNNIANIFEQLNQTDNALENYKIALKYAQETENINEVMAQYEVKYPDFKFFGGVPVDFATIDTRSYPDEGVKKIQAMDYDKLIASGKTKWGFIFNLDTHTQNGSHWVSAFSDLKKQKIYRACCRSFSSRIFAFDVNW